MKVCIDRAIAMPKYIKIRSKGARQNFSCLRDEDFYSNMAKYHHHKHAANEVPFVRALVEKFIEHQAARSTPTPLKGYDDEFSCSRCSQLLHQPVTGPCGYNFCMTCTKETDRCERCGKEHGPTSFFKLNVVLDTILEHWFPEQYSMRSLTRNGEQLLENGAFSAAEAKFSEVLKQNPYDSYALHQRALARRQTGNWKGGLMDIISAKIKNYSVPEASKATGKHGFVKRSSREDTIFRTATKTFLEVMSIVSRPLGVSSSAKTSRNAISQKDVTGNNLSGETTMPELDSALDSIISRNMCNVETLCNGEEVDGKAPTKRPKRMSENSKNFDDTDFCCILCTMPFFEPVCTPCGHTFCLGCLERCFDHGRSCPMCKTSLNEIYQYQKCLLPIDRSVESIIRKHLPELSTEREKMRRKEQEKLRETLPIFVCTVALPSVKCMLHVFEPRYRLMIRRATRVHDGNLGMTMSSNTAPFHKVGTVIKLQDVSFYEDGRSLVTSVGTKRFEVDEYSTCDGYNTAKVKYIVDEEENDEKEEKETQKIVKEVYSRVKDWFAGTSDHFKNAITKHYGDFPERDETKGDNGPHWPWWVLASLPVKDDIKAYVLAKNRLRARLAVINLIIQKLEGKRV